MRPAHDGWTARPVDGNYNYVFIFFHPSRPGAQQECEAFLLEHPLKFRGNFGIFAGNNLCRTLNYGHAAAEPAKHLSELQSDVSPAKHNQVPGKYGQVYDVLIGQIRDRVQPWNPGIARTPASIDEYLLRFQQGFSHADLVNVHKSCLPAIEMQIRTALHLLFSSLAEAMNHLIFLRHNRVVFHTRRPRNSSITTKGLKSLRESVESLWGAASAAP